MLDEHKAKNLRIHRGHTGWTTESEVLKSIANIQAKVREISDRIKSGNYMVYFPGPDAKYLRKDVDTNIEKIRNRIKDVQTRPDYIIPVHLFGMMDRVGILAMQKKSNLTKEQRAGLSRGLAQIGPARSGA